MYNALFSLLHLILLVLKALNERVQSLKPRTGSWWLITRAGMRLLLCTLLTLCQYTKQPLYRGARLWEWYVQSFMY